MVYVIRALEFEGVRSEFDFIALYVPALCACDGFLLAHHLRYVHSRVHGPKLSNHRSKSYTKNKPFFKKKLQNAVCLVASCVSRLHATGICSILMGRHHHQVLS